MRHTKTAKALKAQKRVDRMKECVAAFENAFELEQQISAVNGVNMSAPLLPVKALDAVKLAQVRTAFDELADEMTQAGMVATKPEIVFSDGKPDAELKSGGKYATAFHVKGEGVDPVAFMQSAGEYLETCSDCKQSVPEDFFDLRKLNKRIKDEKGNLEEDLRLIAASPMPEGPDVSELSDPTYDQPLLSEAQSRSL